MTAKTLTAALTATLLSTPLMAGSMDPATPEPQPMQPVTPAPVMVGGDWTGPYAGVQIGNLNVDDDVEGDDMIYGLHAGYDYDFGRFVMGGEIDYDTGPVDLGGPDLDDVTRLKLRAGYDLGQALVYATAGGARINTDVGDATGAFGGLGMAYKVTERIDIGAELLTHRFEDIGDTNLDADANSINLRASFRF